MPPNCYNLTYWKVITYFYYSAICWWVFTALTTTLRTLRLRRNKVKFGLYRHFTNVLIFSVIASVVFMLINIKLFKLEACLKGKVRIYRFIFSLFWFISLPSTNSGIQRDILVTLPNIKSIGLISDWRELWVDEAFWHFQFSILLAFIMVLWTPSNNNKRYAFQPLLDNDGKRIMVFMKFMAWMSCPIVVPLCHCINSPWYKSCIDPLGPNLESLFLEPASPLPFDYWRMIIFQRTIPMMRISRLCYLTLTRAWNTAWRFWPTEESQRRLVTTIQVWSLNILYGCL